MATLPNTLVSGSAFCTDRLFCVLGDMKLAVFLARDERPGRFEIGQHLLALWSRRF
ncbi:hypothetical protein C100_02165 [Sphingobium sp. C100]|nr:hypothetical protein C100_02165 [Sphingobium sp. C100]